MKIKVPLEKLWAIPSSTKKEFSTKKIEEFLGMIGLPSDGNFFMMDFYHKKVIMGSPCFSTVCGWSKDAIEEGCFDFFYQALEKSEVQWLDQLTTEVHKLLYKYPETNRKQIEFYYDLTLKTPDDHEILLHHKLVPFRFDDNGNMWLALVYTTPKRYSQNVGKATAINVETGEKYVFRDGTFHLSKIKKLTKPEIDVLLHISASLTVEKICEKLQITNHAFKKRLKTIRKKLQAKTTYEAIYKAAVMKHI
ncbi:MAG: hypothetical protein LBP96_00085 [Bacteroidales bacterium]|jgi:DNA-binding CsgD family transcriptional regulator|nr:hypothetical protein [Bacteroidales bacterium]